MLANKLMSALSGGAEDKLYVDDVFSAYTYTGNGSTQTINNGIDLAGKGGLVWIKSRTTTDWNWLFDTVRGGNNGLSSNSTGTGGGTGGSSFTSSGFVAGGLSGVNGAGSNLVSWCFRKAPKFFDVVTYTGNGVTGRQIPHELGIAPGMVIVKRTDLNGNWCVWHKSTTGDLFLNLTQAQAGNFAFITGANINSFTVDANTDSNGSGATYVAYLFAHDPSADGIIQCGSFTADASGNATVNLGWEPQYLLTKHSSAAGDSWRIHDSARGMTADQPTAQLYADQSAAEGSGNVIQLQSTGFKKPNSAATSTHIYLAIRRPNKPPTTGTEVYNAIARTGTGAAATVTGVGFAPDLVHSQDRVEQSAGSAFYDRLRGGSAQLLTTRQDAEFNNGTQIKSSNMDGYTASVDTVMYPAINSPTVAYINHFFRRAPGFMDVVCYTGTGSATTVAHNLGAVPELMIVKGRSNAFNWPVYHVSLGTNTYLALNGTFNSANFAPSDVWNNTLPTSASFPIGLGATVNAPGATYVAYLFASLSGISKVGSYTGNGTTQTINCGFTTGARFILIKRTNSTGDWYVWDTARGIVAGNDPHMSLNNSVAEVINNDSVDPDVSGFIVNQVAATNINVSGGQYIFLAIA